MLIRTVLLLLFYVQYSSASVVMVDGQKKYSDFSLSYRYDEKSTLSVTEIAESNFTQTIPSQFALGYKKGNAWFKITLKNQSHNHDFVLSFSEPFWNTLDLFEPTPNGWIEYKNGLSTPLNERLIEDISPAFLLHLNPGESKTYFIRGQTSNSHIGAFNLYTDKEFFRPSRLTLSTFYLFYSGVLFIIVILNIFLLLEMKERIYGYYIGYVSSFIVFIGMFSGSYLYLGFGPWKEGLHVVGTVVLSFMALFSGTFLELKKYFPKMDLLFKFFTSIFLFSGMLILLEIPYATLAFNILSSLFVTILLILAIRTWLMGKIQAHYYLIALIIYMPTMALMVLTFDALLLNTDFTRYSFLFGAFIEIIFFSLILASRFHIAKYDKIRLQKALLSEKQKNQEYLEHEVERQHQEIKEKNAILFQQSKNAAMGEMISMIAHQWRQPLNTLALINQDFYFKHKLGKCNEACFEHCHNQIDEHLQYMSKTIDDFRNYYSNDKEKKPENIQEIVELALRLSETFLHYAHIDIEWAVNTDKKVFLSKNEMIQVVLNLIKNAHDAIVEQNISFGKITITSEDTDTSVSIHICDTGGGISESVAANIFDPYFSTKSKNGTGLGLYMSKCIVEDQCNGSLTFQNTQSGVCFIITLPTLYDGSTEA